MSLVSTLDQITPQTRSKLILPNVRKLFIPDPGYTILEADLSGADAQVVAWEAEDEDLKTAFKQGLKVHIKNCRDMFPDKVRGWTDEAIKATDRTGGIYYNNKRCIHGTNYGGTSRGLAQALGWTVAETDNFQRRWFGLHPGIPDRFHGKVRRGLADDRTIWNRYGFRRVYFDRIDQCFTEGLAWIPQSTVAITTYLGAFQLEEKILEAQILLQVHDSLVFQIPTGALRSGRIAIRAIKDALTVVTPYPDPLTIPWGLTASLRSWGDCEKFETVATLH